MEGTNAAAAATAAADVEEPWAYIGSVKTTPFDDAVAHSINQGHVQVMHRTTWVCELIRRYDERERERERGKRC